MTPEQPIQRDAAVTDPWHLWDHISPRIDRASCGAFTSGWHMTTNPVAVTCHSCRVAMERSNG